MRDPAGMRRFSDTVAQRGPGGHGPSSRDQPGAVLGLSRGLRGLGLGRGATGPLDGWESKPTCRLAGQRDLGDVRLRSRRAAGAARTRPGAAGGRRGAW